MTYARLGIFEWKTDDTTAFIARRSEHADQCQSSAASFEARSCPFQGISGETTLKLWKYRTLARRQRQCGREIGSQIQGSFIFPKGCGVAVASGILVMVRTSIILTCPVRERMNTSKANTKNTTKGMKDALKKVKNAENKQEVQTDKNRNHKKNRNIHKIMEQKDKKRKQKETERKVPRPCWG